MHAISPNSGILATTQSENRFGKAKGEGVMFDTSHSHLSQLPGNASVIGPALENHEEPAPVARVINIIDTRQRGAPTVEQIELTGLEQPGTKAAQTASISPVPDPPAVVTMPVPPQVMASPPAHNPIVDPAVRASNTANDINALVASLVTTTETVPAVNYYQQTQPVQQAPITQPIAQPFDYAGYVELSFLQPNLAPKKPKKRVLFETPLGSITVRYHDVVIGEHSLALVFDRRDDESDQFVPVKTVGDVPPLRLTIEGPNRQPLNLRADNLGISFTFGCFDILVLVLTPVESARDDGQVQEHQQDIDPMAMVYPGGQIAGSPPMGPMQGRQA